MTDNLVPIILRGGGSVYTGYGNVLIELAIELDRRLPVGVWLHDVTMGLPREFTVILEREIPVGYEIYLEITSPMQCAGKMTKAFTVLYTMWEQTKFLNNCHLPEMKSYDLIITPSFLSAEVIKSYLPNALVEVVPLGIDVNRFRYQKRSLKGPIKFCTFGYMSKRKGVDIAIDAFREVSSKRNCYLDIHTTGITLPDEWYEMPKVNIITIPLSRKGVIQWYYDHDVFLATSRGEGFNLPAVEFLSTGGSVIGAPFGGHAMWMGKDFCYPVSFVMTKVTKKAPWQSEKHMFIDELFLDGTSEWAEPNLQEIIDSMIRCIDDRDELALKMKNTEIIRKQFNIQKTTSHLLSVIAKNYKVRKLDDTVKI